MRSERLEMRWMPVADPAGRARMVASWVPVRAAAPTMTSVGTSVGTSAATSPTSATHAA